MTETEFTAILQPLLDAFPSFASYYTTHRQTLRKAMMAQLANIDAADATVIVGKLVDGELLMPANYEYDRVGIVIKIEAADIRSKRNERQRMVSKYFNQRSGAMDYVRSSRAGHIAIELGAMVKRKQITVAENDLMMIDLLKWDKDQIPEPEWVSRLFGVTRQEAE